MGNSVMRFTKTMSFAETKPLVLILGSTGVGKSKLAIDIASRLNGEIISVDSMQVYKGLDIATNKVTEEERLQCPHHFVDFASPNEEYTVVQFQKQALELIDDLHKRNKLPVLAGGTTYYAVSVLWEYLVRTETNPELWQINDRRRKELEAMPSEKLHKMLSELDPRAADHVHNQNKRKIIRHLEVLEETGESLLDIWEKQKSQDGSGPNSGPVRFPHACIFWLQCDMDAGCGNLFEVCVYALWTQFQRLLHYYADIILIGITHPLRNVLEERIQKRTSSMLEQGLLKELTNFHHDYNDARLKHTSEAEYEHGIFQNIGLKEFHNYLTAPCDATDTKRDLLFKQAIRRMNERTFQYAKKQRKEVRLRIVNRPNGLPVYGLDTSHIEQWETSVRDPALRVIRSVYEDNNEIVSRLKSVPDGTVIQPLPKESYSPTTKHFVCDLCGGRMIAAHDWEAHLKSTKHLNLFHKRKRQLTQISRILSARARSLAKAPPTPSPPYWDLNSASSDDEPFLLFEMKDSNDEVLKEATTVT